VVFDFTAVAATNFPYFPLVQMKYENLFYSQGYAKQGDIVLAAWAQIMGE